MKRVHRLLFAAAILLPPPLPAQVPGLEEVPADLPAHRRAPLLTLRDNLERVRDRLSARAAVFKSRCAEVTAGTPEDAGCARDQESFNADKRRYVQAVENFNQALATTIKAVRDANPGSIDNIRVPIPVIRTLEEETRWSALRGKIEHVAARLRSIREPFIALLRDDSLTDAIAVCYEFYRTGQDANAAMRCHSRQLPTLEQARAQALNDLREYVKRWQEQQQRLARARSIAEQDPVLREIIARHENVLREVEGEADARIKAGLVLPQDEDLKLLFDRNRKVMVWPGPANPDAPLPNPLAEASKREKVKQMILWERREGARMLAIFESDPMFSQYLLESVLVEAKATAR